MSRKRIFFKRNSGLLRGHGAAVGVGAGAVVILTVAAVLFASSDAPPKRKIPEVSVVILQPPPPPEPEVVPPEPEEAMEQEPEPEPEMIEQPEVDEPEPEPEADQPEEEPLPEAATDEPPEPGEASDTLGLDAVGEGPGDGFNLAGRPGGRGLLSGRRGGGSRWGWYAYIVQDQVEKALRLHKRTRLFTGRVEVRLWADGRGRITRAELLPSTGNAEVDAAIRNEVLIGLKLKEPPPADMPMPIVARLTARRPG